MNSSKLPFFDFARSLACFMVVLTHLRVNNFSSLNNTSSEFGSVFKTIFFQITRLGLESVLVFFVLSGYLIASSTLNSLSKNKFSIYNYFVNRFSRIYTPYIPSILFSVFIAYIFDQCVSISNLYVNIFCLQGIAGQPLFLNSSLWSVSYEVWFYIIFGMFINMISNRSYLSITLFALSIFPFFFLKYSLLFCWLIGASFCILHKFNHIITFIISLVLVIFGVIITQLTSVSKQIDLSYFSFLNRDIGYFILSFGIGGILLSCKLLFDEKSFISKISFFFAGFSYTVYLFHIPLIILLRHIGLVYEQDILNVSSISFFIINILIIYILSYFLYLVFEKNTSYVRLFFAKTK